MTQRRLSPADKQRLAAKRKRRHRQVIRNRIIFGVACLAILALIIFGVVKLVGFLTTGYDRADVSTLHINQDGTITFEEIADFDESEYDAKEFKEYTKGLVQSYNETMGDDAIVIDELSVKEQKAYVRTTYSSADVYTTFTSYGVFYGSVESAVESGYDFSDIIDSVGDGIKEAAVEFDNPSFFSEYQVAIIKENTTVTVPGTIKYISSYNTELFDASTVKIVPDDGNEDACELVYIFFSEETEDTK